jgi:hypothetical protein
MPATDTPHWEFGFTTQNIPLSVQYNAWNHIEVTVKLGNVPQTLDASHSTFELWVVVPDATVPLGARIQLMTLNHPVRINGSSGGILYIEIDESDLIANNVPVGTSSYELNFYDDRDTYPFRYKLFTGQLTVLSFLVA